MSNRILNYICMHEAFPNHNLIALRLFKIASPTLMQIQNHATQILLSPLTQPVPATPPSLPGPAQIQRYNCQHTQSHSLAAITAAMSGIGKGTSARCHATISFTTRNNSVGPGHALSFRARIWRNKSIRSMTATCNRLSGGSVSQLPLASSTCFTLCSMVQRLPT